MSARLELFSHIKDAVVFNIVHYFIPLHSTHQNIHSMSNYEIRTLEERIAAIEENLGITGAKTLQQASEEEAAHREEADAQAFRAQYAHREISRYVASI